MAVTKVLDYTCFIKGIFGRNRSVKTTTLKLRKGVDPANPLPDSEVIALAMQAMKDAKAKPGTFYKIDENPVERDDQGNGIVFEKFALFSERCIEKGVLP